MPETIPTTRPSDRSPAILKKVAERLLPKLKGWLGEDDDRTDEDTIQEVVNALEYSWDLDGFKLANKLDWDGDSQLVDILDMASLYASQAYNEILKEWVIAAHIKPTFKVGDKVRVIAERKYRADKGVEHVGEIIQVDTDIAVYVVCITALGHIGMENEGKPMSLRRTGTNGILYPFEDVRPEIAKEA